jgi:DNA-binding SARP family transcriptional activator/predicted ATPase/TolA-binding protein
MTEKLAFSLLGTVVITLNGEPISGRIPAKSQALLCYLAATGQVHSREKLAGLLWGDKPDDKAKANLRRALSDLRQWLGDALTITRQTVALNRDSDYLLDVEIFESALAEDQLATGDLDPLREAVELYRGEFLEGFSIQQALEFEEWVLQERERLRQLAIEALHRLSEACTARGEYAGGIEHTNRLLALEPWQEDAHRQLMLLLARSGQNSAALAQYETCCRVLAEELGVEPMPETQALYYRLKTQRETSPHNLPPQTTPFVGRQAELAQIARHLDQPDCRLLTLIGAGGIGKTRLALQAAGQALDAYADGVYFVPLAGIGSSESLVPTILEALHCPLPGETDPKRQLLKHLQQREMLLVLDNFESLFSLPADNGGARGLVLEMVRRAPKLKLLVTSRERLNLQVEWLLALQGLRYPPAEATLGDETFEAVELFEQRAQQVRPGFSLSAEWPEVVHICRILDGMPLAIELAATWVSMMPCAEIVQELSRGLDLLSTTMHDVPARHKSLKAVFDHSWQLLSESEREAFERLSVFQGGFSRQAANEVAEAPLSTLAALVNKSLLRVVSPGQYDMLEPLKQYAALRLAEGVKPASSATRERHGRYYLHFLQAREGQLQSEVQSQTLEEIRSALNNIQVAWRWAVDHNRFDLVERVARSLFLFCDIQSRFRTGDALFNYATSPLETLTGAESPEQCGVLGILLACRGRLLYSRGEYQTARSVLERSLRACNACAHLGWAAFSLHSLALVAVAQGDYQQAKQFAKESLALCRESDSQWDEAWALFALGLAAYSLGEYAPAQQFTQQSLALHRQLGNRHGEAACLNTLGLIICGLYEGDADWYGEAQAIFEENLAIRRAIGDRLGEATALHNLGYIHFKMHNYDRARVRFEASLEISQMIASLNTVAATSMWLGMLALEQQDYSRAKHNLARALRIAYENNALTRVTDVLFRIGDLLQHTDQHEAAVEYLTFVRHHPATDDRVRTGAQEFLEASAAVLSPETLEMAQASGRARTLDDLVIGVLQDTM